jgi:hypothetical protein
MWNLRTYDEFETQRLSFNERANVIELGIKLKKSLEW